MCTLPDLNRRSRPEKTVDSTVCLRKDCRSPDLVAVQAMSGRSYPGNIFLTRLETDRAGSALGLGL